MFAFNKGIENLVDMIHCVKIRIISSMHVEIVPKHGGKDRTSEKTRECVQECSHGAQRVCEMGKFCVKKRS